ncbi:unnamed protein product [Ceratitis capitata]|uniref:(Mediterranean fruit fly) hypothetical protein n=1 Tax=Ceratitis capitata TaxID=7213 RepID=A0A811UT85_CERCA|nr:unnamed protein product [Ceratitis capitata]
MTRQDATEVLMSERDRGVFLVRDSNSIAGDFVLCDQDDLPFRRGEILTIILIDEDQWWTAKNQQGQIGQIPVPYVQRCEDNTEWKQLWYYVSWYFGPMTRQDATEVLMSERDRGVFLVRDSNSIAGDFVLCCEDNTEDHSIDRPFSSGSNCGIMLGPSNNQHSALFASVTCKSDATIHPTTTNCHQLSNSLKTSDLNRKLPAYARVKQARVPNAYDKTALKLEIGDIIKASDPLLKAEREPERLKGFGIWPFQNSWYFGPMTRQDATEVLMSERDRGVFLVRDSNSIAGDFVLCVREDTKVSNYIINKIQQQDQTFYRIGDQLFENLPKLLTFYTLHYLDTTPLRRPAPKKPEKVISRYNFEGSDQDDLPFRRGEILTIIRKDEDQW